MVIYNLLCKKKHSFEGWFPSFEDFQKQADKKLISCPTCGTHQSREGAPCLRCPCKKRTAAAPPAKSPEETPPGAAVDRAEFKEMLIRCTITSKRISKTSARASPKKPSRFTKAKRGAADSRHRHRRGSQRTRRRGSSLHSPAETGARQLTPQLFQAPFAAQSLTSAAAIGGVCHCLRRLQFDRASAK